LRAGAHGYLLKTIEGDLLAQAIHRAMKGEAVVSPEMTGKLVTAFRAASARPPSSRRRRPIR
jgi:two-component system nitrate/nitrite response regulator NarL